MKVINYVYIFKGVYVPLTVEGNIMIDGILASCYTVVDHDLGQIVMKPVQQYFDIMEFVFGNENGVSAYVSVAQNLGRWVLPDYSKLNFWMKHSQSKKMNLHL